MTDKPEVIQTISGYTFNWPGYSTTIHVNHLQASGEKLNGEITIMYKAAKIYPATQLNFLSDRSRKGLASNLNKKVEGTPWDTMFDQLSDGVETRARRGEEVKELWTSDEIPDLEFLLEPVLIKGVPSIIFGEKGVAKSTLTHIIYLCLMLPWVDNPLGFTAPRRSVKTMILDYESPGYIAQRNVKRLQEGMGLPPIPLWHRRCTMPLSQEIEQVANHIADRKIEVLIIDSLARACGGDLNKTEPANAFFEALAKLNVTSLIVAQTSKDTESKRKTVFGSSLFTYYARSIFELCLSDYTGDDTIDIALFHRWANYSKRYPEMGFHLNYNGTHTTIESQAVSFQDFKAKVSIRSSILELLKRDTFTAKDIAESLDASLATTKMTLSRLVKQGRIMNLSGNKWGLSL